MSKGGNKDRENGANYEGANEYTFFLSERWVNRKAIRLEADIVDGKRKVRLRKEYKIGMGSTSRHIQGRKKERTVMK